MPLDPRTPVLVGVGAAHQRGDDPEQLAEAATLVCDAVDAASADAGAPALRDRADLVLVPNGTWGYADLGRLVAAHLGGRARTVLAEIGVLQQTLFNRAAGDIAAGAADVVVVCGGEAKYRALRAAITGRTAPERTQPVGTAPDEYLAPAGDILTAMEIERDLAVPAHQYALIDNALRHADGMDASAHRARLGRLWGAFAAVAAHNPDAWDRSAPSPSTITTATPGNRVVATPYTKLLCSQWNVDQAAALILTSVETADRLGIDRDRWVFPLVGVESNHMVPLPARASLSDVPAFATCVDAAWAHTDLGLDDVALLELYSCFPAAVQVQARALGLALDDPRGLTLTGGMTFAGGPLNNFVLQAMVTMARALRGDPDAVGLSSSVSGMLTKVGLGLWSASPAAPAGRPFGAIDVSADAERRTATRPLDAALVGSAAVVGHTVVHEQGVPARVVAVVEGPDGVRSVARCAAPGVVDALLEEDWAGRMVDLPTPGWFEPRPTG